MTWIFIHVTFATRKKFFLIVEMSLPKLRTYQQTFELYLVSQGTCPPTQNTTGRSFATKGKRRRQQDGMRGQGVCTWTPRTGSDQPLNRVCQFLRGWLNFLMCTAGNENQTPRNPRKMPGTFQAIRWLCFTMFNMIEVAPARGGKCHQECDSGGTAVGRTLWGAAQPWPGCLRVTAGRAHAGTWKGRLAETVCCCLPVRHMGPAHWEQRPGDKRVASGGCGSPLPFTPQGWASKRSGWDGWDQTDRVWNLSPSLASCASLSSLKKRG